MAEYKFNLLIDELPTTVEVDGSSFSINTDFRYGLLFNQCIDDDELDENTRLMQALNIGYKDNIPEDKIKAFKALIEFYSCAILDNRDIDKELEKQEKKDDESEEYEDEYSGNCEIYFDYEKDSNLIYSTFLQVFHIDLIDSDMHWFKFIVLLRSLFDENNLTKVIQFRAMKIDSKLSPDMKKYYKNMKEHYSLNKLSDAEKEDYKKKMMEQWG